MPDWCAWSMRSPPREARRLAVELLVPVVAPAADPLREKKARRNGVHHQPHAVPRVPHDERADDNAYGDRAPDPETSVPDGREAVPVLVDRRILVPTRDVVVRARADDPR